MWQGLQGGHATTTTNNNNNNIIDGGGVGASGVGRDYHDAADRPDVVAGAPLPHQRQPAPPGDVSSLLSSLRLGGAPTTSTTAPLPGASLLGGAGRGVPQPGFDPRTQEAGGGGSGPQLGGGFGGNGRQAFPAGDSEALLDLEALMRGAMI
jgi:hypothetical protein